MKTRWMVALAASIVLLAASLPASAQTAAGATSAKDEAIRRVPTYESAEADGETPQSAFLQLAEDTIFISEIGARSPGSVPIWPRGALKTGPVLLFPYLTGKISWTDNVFQQEEERSSWYATEGGGFTGQWEFLGGSGSVSFGADYQHRDYFNRDLSYSEWVAGIGLGYRFPMGLWFKAGVKWERLVDPIGIEFAGELRRDQFYPFFDLGLDNAFGNKINLEVGIQHLNADFDNDDLNSGDRKEWNAHAKISYPFFKETTRIFVRGDYLWADREADVLNDLDRGLRVSAGVEGSFPLTKTERLLGFIQIGARKDAYGDARTLRVGSATVTTDDDDKQSVISVIAGLRYLMGAKTSLNLRLLRDLQFSSRANYQTINRVDLTVTHNVLRSLIARVAGFFEHADPSDGGTVTGTTHSFTRFGFGLGARYILIENVDLDLALDWSKRNTSQEGYDHDAFVGSLGVTLYFR